MKEKSEKVDLKLNIHKTKIMASGPITLWQIDGEAMETVTDFILGGFKITADGDCSHEIEGRLVLEKAEEPEIKLPTSAGLWEKQESSRKTSISALLTKTFDCVDHNKLWKILQEMGIPDHLTYLLRNQYVDQEATVRTGHGTTDWFQIGKGVRQGCILSPCLYNLYAEYIMRNAGLEETQLESGLPGEISITSDMQMTPPLMQKVKRN